MKLNSLFVLMLLLAAIAGCGGGGGSSPKTLVSIDVTPANQSIPIRTTQQFSATGTFSDNTTQDLTASVTWTSTRSQVATIDATIGVATSVAAGTTTITATSGSITNSTSLTVTPGTLVSLVIQPANSSTPLGTPLQFSATGTLLDNTTLNLTSSVTWSSSLTSVATISNTGKATPVSTGTTTITATSGSITNSTSLTVIPAAVTPANVMQITVDGSLCSSGSYINKPCVSVKICTPDNSACGVVTDLLLDTGSYGLRIFKKPLQDLGISLPQVPVSSGSLAGCVHFGDGSTEWGPIQMASVTLGNELAVQVPIQVVDATFGTPTGCGTPDVQPSDAGFNGILGVGLFAQDCGAHCVTSANNGMYYACNGAACSGTTVPLTSQVQNPVALLPKDNNGVLVQLPSVSLGGLPSVNGSLILGIGTQSNNSPAAATTYPANSVAEFTTTLNGKSFSNSFIDSGSNGFYFSATNANLAGQLPPCASPNASFYCPATTASLSATNTGAFGSPSGPVPFQIGNASNLFSTPNNVFSEVGGSIGGLGGFDWGLPFFFGKNVFVGIEGTSSPLSPPGNGPYWAY